MPRERVKSPAISRQNNNNSSSNNNIFLLRTPDGSTTGSTAGNLSGRSWHGGTGTVATTTMMGSGSADGIRCASSGDSTGLSYYNLPDEGPCTLELSSTINTVLPTLRRSTPSFTAQSRHFSGFAGGSGPSSAVPLAPPPRQRSPVEKVIGGDAKSRDDASLKEFIRSTSASKNANQGGATAVRRASAGRVDAEKSPPAHAEDDNNDEYDADVTRVISKSFSISSASDVEPTDYRAKARSFHGKQRTAGSTISVSSSIESAKDERFVQFQRAQNHLANGAAVLVLPKPAQSPGSTSASSTSTTPSELVTALDSSHISHSPSMLSIHLTSGMRSTSSVGDDDIDAHRRTPTSADDRELTSRMFADDVASRAGALTGGRVSPTRLGGHAWRTVSMPPLETQSEEDVSYRRISTNSSSSQGKATHDGSNTSADEDDNAGAIQPAQNAGGVLPVSVASNGQDRRSSLPRRSHYLGELVWQVDDIVFCGGIEAAHNENLLCRLNIAFIVDISCQYDDPDLKNRPRNECPCLCPRRTAHSRTTMYINVRDHSDPSSRSSDLSGSNSNQSTDKKSEKERDMIIESFHDLMVLTQNARIKDQRVLIHSLRGRNRAPAFVAAYLMQCTRCTRVQACTRISKMMSKMRPGLCISDDLQRALMRWQTTLGIRSEDNQLDENSLTRMFTVKRSAWGPNSGKC